MHVLCRRSNSRSWLNSCELSQRDAFGTSRELRVFSPAAASFDRGLVATGFRGCGMRKHPRAFVSRSFTEGEGSFTEFLCSVEFPKLFETPRHLKRRGTPCLHAAGVVPFIHKSETVGECASIRRQPVDSFGSRSLTE
jgi:hypothetical protein